MRESWGSVPEEAGRGFLGAAHGDDSYDKVYKERTIATAATAFPNTASHLWSSVLLVDNLN